MKVEFRIVDDVLCNLKQICNLHRLIDPEPKPEMVKSSLSSKIELRIIDYKKIGDNFKVIIPSSIILHLIYFDVYVCV